MTGALAACSSRNVQLVTLTNRDITPSGAGTQTATFTISSDGTVKDQDSTVLEQWRNGGPASGYDVHVVASGAAPTGSATGAWLNLGSDRSWTVEDTTNNGASNPSVLTVQIAHTGTTTAIESASIRLEPNRTS